MIFNLNGEFETVDFSQHRSVLLYDNVQNEEYPLHWHNAMEIIMPLTNDFEVICAGHHFHLRERDILIIPAGALHNLKAQAGRRLILLCDNNSFKGNPALSELTSVVSEPILINSEYDADFVKSMNGIIRDIYVLYSNFTDITEVYIYIKVLTLLARVKEYQICKVECDYGGMYADKFRLILKYIDQNYMNNITLDELARLAGYSACHFSRIFKKYSGTTFIGYLNRRRVRAAELLLLDSKKSVTSVAMQVGFSSLTTFNRVFKEINGCTPSDYKKLYRTSQPL